MQPVILEAWVFIISKTARAQRENVRFRCRANMAHTTASQGQILALAFRSILNTFYAVIFSLDSGHLIRIGATVATTHHLQRYLTHTKQRPPRTLP